MSQYKMNRVLAKHFAVLDERGRVVASDSGLPVVRSVGA